MKVFIVRNIIIIGLAKAIALAELWEIVKVFVQQNSGAVKKNPTLKNEKTSSQSRIDLIHKIFGSAER